MTGEPEGSLSIRDHVDAVITVELAQKLLTDMTTETDVEIFRSDLVRAFTRYKRLKTSLERTKKKAKRVHLTKVRDTANRFIFDLKALPRDIYGELQDGLDRLTDEERYEGWDFFSGDPMPESDDSLHVIELAARNIIAASQAALDEMYSSKGQPRGSESPELDQLIVELSDIFEALTGLSAESQCYREEYSNDDYGGKFYKMVKASLDAFADQDYKTPAGLGMRILRKLRLFREPNT